MTQSSHQGRTTALVADLKERAKTDSTFLKFLGEQVIEQPQDGRPIVLATGPFVNIYEPLSLGAVVPTRVQRVQCDQPWNPANLSVQIALVPWAWPASSVAPLAPISTATNASAATSRSHKQRRTRGPWSARYNRCGQLFARMRVTATYRLMAACRSTTPTKAPRLRRRLVSAAKKPSNRVQP